MKRASREKKMTFMLSEVCESSVTKAAKEEWERDLRNKW